MAKSQRGKTNMGRVRRRIMMTVVAVAAGIGLLGFAYAQSSTSLSLNSPVSFPVDI